MTLSERTSVRPPGPRASRVPIIGAFLFLLLMLPALVHFYTDWLWFGETGYQQIFLRSLTSKLLLGSAIFLAAFGLLFGNLWLALKLLRQPYLIIGAGSAEVQPLVLDRRQLRYIAVAAAGLVALLMAFFAASQWLVWLRARYATPFGDVDPIFGRDVAFYVFQLPFLDLVRGLFLVLVLLSLAGATLVYVLTGAVGFDQRVGLSVDRRARQHLALLGAALFVVLTFGAWLEMARLLVTPAGIIQGAAFTDIHATLPALRILMVAGVVAVGLAAFHAFSTAGWPIFAAGGIYLLVSLAGSGYAAIVQRAIVAPNEQEKETPYIIHNIAATRKAFALDNVEERELSGDAVLTRADIEANAETIRNVRLWDHQPLLDTFAQIQEIRTYYDFASVDNDRYHINGEYRQIMLSARELNSNSLPNRTWVNERLVFTHGYGITLGPVNQATQEGLPVLFIRNLPPETSVDLEVTEPSIYFGELSNDYVIVNTRTQEFHYPRGEDNVFTRYAGDAGLPLGGLLRRALFAIRFRSLDILISDQLAAESRILFHRNINERVTAIAPFLVYDGDPYLVIHEGRLFWIRDAYTVTNHYPYSSVAPTGINYIRNSVKVVIDALNGTTTYYLAEPDDPLAQTLARIFPGFLRPLEEMPENLQRHIRYPEGIFSHQTAMYSTYHMTNPEVFYNKEDQWEVPTIDMEGRTTPMQPYYTIMRLPGEERAEFIQMLPFTPRLKDNLAAWMVARSDQEQYGRLLVFRFPKQKVIFGPRQVVGRINQDEVIAPQITLWNQQGSTVIQGTLLVIPIEESLLYVRPLYLRAAGGRIPELKRVIVAYQNRIVMEETLEDSLDRIFGPSGRDKPIPARPMLTEAEPAVGMPVPASGPGPAFSETLAREARQHYERALQAQRDGNWAQYGEEIRRLGQVLEQMGRPE